MSAKQCIGRRQESVKVSRQLFSQQRNSIKVRKSTVDGKERTGSPKGSPTSPLPESGAADVERAMVLHTHNACKTTGELTLLEGQIIQVLDKKTRRKGWWKGRTEDGVVGIFDHSIVQLVPPTTDRVTADEYEYWSLMRSEDFGDPSAIGPEGVAELASVKFAYEAEDVDGLSLAEGDTVRILNKDHEDDGWLEGEIMGRTGLFPKSYVTLLPPRTTVNTERRLQYINQREGNNAEATVLVIRSYQAKLPDDVRLVKGQTVKVVDRQLDDKGWWYGEVEGRVGVFPSSFVKLRQSPEKAASRVQSVRSSHLSVHMREKPKGKVRALVHRHYSACEDDELSLRKGEEIVVLDLEADEGWWRVSCDGQVGLFPSNYCTLLADDDHTCELPRPRSSGLESKRRKKEQAEVLYSYEAQKESDLSLMKGEIITILNKNRELDGWWMGESKGKTGYFPSNYVQILIRQEKTCMLHSPRSSSLESKRKKKEQAEVLCSYVAQKDDDLTLVEGEIITILNKNLEFDGWWMGESKGKTGHFPSNYVQILAQQETALDLLAPMFSPRLARKSINIGNKIEDSVKDIESMMCDVEVS